MHLFEALDQTIQIGVDHGALFFHMRDNRLSCLDWREICYIQLKAVRMFNA